MVPSAAPLPPVWPFLPHPAMPPEAAVPLHLLLTAHTALTLACFLAGPVMIWQAARDRAGLLYWVFAALPLVVLVQRLAYGGCFVEDVARRLWGGLPSAVWAPDLYGVHASWMTYVVDACIVSYAVGAVASVALFLRRRRGFFGGARTLPSARAPR